MNVGSARPSPRPRCLFAACFFLILTEACGDGGQQSADALAPTDAASTPDAQSDDAANGSEDQRGDADVPLDTAIQRDTAEPADAAGSGDSVMPDRSSDPPVGTDSAASDGPLLDAGPCMVDHTFTAQESAAFFPFQAGARWIYQGTSGGASPIPFSSTREVTGSRPGGTGSAWVVHNTNSDGNRVDIEEYLEISPTGLLYDGSNNGPNAFPIDPEFFAAPFTAVPFPIQTCSLFESINVTGKDSGRDTDGDGVNETYDIRADTVLRRESVTVPVGVFPDALRVETVYQLTTRQSKSGSVSRQQRTAVDWYAPGVGPVRRTLTALARDLTFDLTAFSVGATSKGVLTQGILATDLPQARSVLTEPIRAGIGFDGQQFLVAMPVTLPPEFTGQGGLQGFLVGIDGKVRRSAPLVENSGDIYKPVVAFDGAQYVIAYYDTGYERVELIAVSVDGSRVAGPNALSNSPWPPPGPPDETATFGAEVVAVGGGILLSFDQTVAVNILQNTVHHYFAVVGGTGQPGSLVTAFPNVPMSAVTLATDGTAALAVWQADGSTVTAPTLLAARMGADGHPIDTAPFAVATVPGGGFSDVSVTFTGNQYVVVWTQSLNGLDTIRAARISSAGDLLDGPATIGGLPIGDPKIERRYPRVMRLGTQALITWEHPLQGIVGTRFTDTGSFLDLSPSQDGQMLTVPQLATATMGWGSDRALWVWTQPQSDPQDRMVDMGSAFAFPW